MRIWLNPRGSFSWKARWEREQRARTWLWQLGLQRGALCGLVQHRCTRNLSPLALGLSPWNAEADSITLRQESKAPQEVWENRMVRTFQVIFIFKQNLILWKVYILHVMTLEWETCAAILPRASSWSQLTVHAKWRAPSSCFRSSDEEHRHF